jgi:hypothetical protein
MIPPAVGGGYEHRPSPYYGGAPPPYGPPPPVGMSGSYGPAPYQHLSMRYGYGPPYGASGSYPPYSSYHSPGPMGGTLLSISLCFRKSVEGAIFDYYAAKG